MQKEDKKLIIHLISDSTGETLKSVGSAAAAQFDQLEYEENVYPLIRSKKNLKRVFDKIKSNPGIVLCTLVDDEIRKRLKDFCNENNVCIMCLIAFTSTESSISS